MIFNALDESAIMYFDEEKGVGLFDRLDIASLILEHNSS